MGNGHKNGSNSLLTEFVPFILKLKKDGAEIQQVENKSPGDHEYKAIQAKEIDEKVVRVELYGDNGWTQVIFLKVEDKITSQRIWGLIYKKKAELDEEADIETASASCCFPKRLTKRRRALR